MSVLPRPLDLPSFPWDQLTPYRKRAAEHPGGVCDLSIGTPVDPTPALIQDALQEHADAPGYPTVIGSPELCHAILAWGKRRATPMAMSSVLMSCVRSCSGPVAMTLS